MSKELIQALAFSAPAVCALVCLAMMLLDYFTEKKKEEKQLRLFLFFTFAVIVLSWLGMIFKVAFHRTFACYFSVYLLTMMFNQILIYRFVYIITATEHDSRFSRLHFVTPVLMMAVSIVTDLIVSLQQKEAIIYGDGKSDSESSRLFSMLYLLTGIVFFIYYTLYPVLGYLRICRYRRSIGNYSADMQRNSLNWLVLMQILTLIIIPVPFAGLLLNATVFSDLFFSIQGAVLAFFVYPILCYNLLTYNYVIITSADNDLPRYQIAEIDPKHFSHYMREKKPYLNPNLRITHIAADLCTNRNYVSMFINHVYGMNFNRFINRYRLKELNRLRNSPDHQENTNMELMLMAGFSSYRSYLRTKKEEDKAKVLKAF